MLELYHAPISTCSQKVRLVLAEKGLEWQSHELDLLRGDQHAPDYRKLNPNAVVPTLVDGGQVLVESTLINEYLDDAYPDPPLKPPAAVERHRMRLLTKLLDESIHPACGTVTFAIGMRPFQLKRPRAEVLATIEKIPSPERREARRSVFEHGIDSPYFDAALATYSGLLDRMEETLAEQPWLAGEGYSLADAGATPYVLRLEHLALGGLFEQGRRPLVADWFRRVRERQAYASAVDAVLPPALVAGFRQAGESVRPTLEAHLGSG